MVNKSNATCSLQAADKKNKTGRQKLQFVSHKMYHCDLVTVSMISKRATRASASNLFEVNGNHVPGNDHSGSSFPYEREGQWSCEIRVAH